MSTNWTQVVKKNADIVEKTVYKSEGRADMGKSKPIKEDSCNDEDNFFWSRNCIEEIAYEMVEYCREYSPNLLIDRAASCNLTEILLDYIYVHNPYKIVEDKNPDELQTEDDFY